MTYFSGLFSLAVLPAASVLFCAACGPSSECSAGDAHTIVDAASDVGPDAPAGDLGTPGSYFAGTACHCETTTSSQETVTYSQDGVALTASRSSDATTCTVQSGTMNGPVLTMHSSGVAEVSGLPPFLAAGITFSTTGTWRCVQGSFRVEFATHTQSGDMFRQYLIAPPQCQLFPCATGLRCSVNADNPVWNACIADGSLSEGVSCNENANCQSGLTCQTNTPTSRVCR